jgi:hypothetical protein
MLTFEKWLTRQTHRADTLGDLAGDFVIDDEWPDGKGIEAYREYLRGTLADDALECAWKEYTSTLPQSHR